MDGSRAAVLVEGSVSAPPSLGLALLGSLDDAAFDELSAAGVLEALRGWERVVGTVAVQQARAVRALAARIGAERGAGRGTLLCEEEITEELALALRISSAQARGMREFADGLGLLPATAAALSAGVLGLGHARVLVDALAGTDPLLEESVRADLEQRLLAYATGNPVTPAQLRRRAQRLLLAVDPDGAAQRRNRARRGRSVSCRPDAHGMAWLSAYLPAQDAAACYAVLDTHARAGVGVDPDDERGLGARRADALTDRIHTGHLDGTGDTSSSTGDPVTRQVHVSVTVSLATLTGRTDSPGELGGYGPIDADLARQLAFSPDATWRRLVTDPLSGTLLDVGTTRYRPPTRLDRYVRHRDQTCRWPGCTTPADRCDLDHTQPYPTGPTNDDNLITLCRRHHRLKTLADFDTEQDTDGRWQVTTPTGRVITTGPPDLAGAGDEPDPPDEPDS